MKTSLVIVTVILFQVTFSKPLILKYDSDSEEIGYYKSSRFEPEKELIVPSHREFSFGEFSNPVVPIRKKNQEQNETTADIENEIIENETADDPIWEQNNDEDNAEKLSNGKYGSDVKAVIKTFLNFLPKNTTLNQLFEEVADILKTVPNEAITNSTIIDQNRKLIM